MLSSSMYSEAHPRRNTVFVSRIGSRDAALASRMNLRDAAHSAPTPSRVPRPSAPLPGQTVRKLVTPTAPTNAFYVLCFQYTCLPLFRRRPTRHHLSPLISFSCRPFPSQRTGTPPPRKKSPACPERSRGAPSFQRFTRSDLQF